MHCDGYSNCGTIVIEYHFPSGTLPDGKRYSGTSRTGYLPDNEEGRECAELLKKSFDRRLTFTIGTSVTTGRSDCVVWNGIHHKTNLYGGKYLMLNVMM
jgi:deltex-like protein